jgi:hypothetical protein
MYLGLSCFRREDVMGRLCSLSGTVDGSSTTLWDLTDEREEGSCKGSLVGLESMLRLAGEGE